MSKPTVAIHKFSSCDGCQLAFLNMGKAFLTLAELVDIQHFAEAGMLNENAPVDIAFIEGSISTPQEQKRIKRVRENSKYLITIGACATSGGIQALRNLHHTQSWVEAIYAKPEYIETLEDVSPISAHVRVNFEIWGCPISSEQIIATLQSLLAGVKPTDNPEKVCMECKRNQNICTLVTKKTPCLGAVSKAGCGAICPAFERNCYACYGPAVDSNTSALSRRFKGFGLLPEDIARHFALFNNNAPVFRNAEISETTNE
ncbi:MAG TPA: sulfhydrogenase subunit delta [Gammaproteobacteria bacterium]|nr:sulfhydrogenase subunit delta [Gammaproteobacteria bacterium]